MTVKNNAANTNVYENHSEYSRFKLGPKSLGRKTPKETGINRFKTLIRRTSIDEFQSELYKPPKFISKSQHGMSGRGMVRRTAPRFKGDKPDVPITIQDISRSEKSGIRSRGRYHSLKDDKM